MDNMIVAGCDVGSLTAKAVILSDEKILASQVMRVTSKPENSAQQIMQATLAKAGLSLNNVACCVGTGYGRRKIPFAREIRSEIACHSKGARWLMPQVRTIIDIGGQDAKAIKINAQGDIVQYVYNDKCASGTGRFLEIMADALEVNLEDMGEIGDLADQPVNISSQCTVFAETEVISLVNEGSKVSNIVFSLHRAMARRVASLAKGIGIENDVVMTGGVAKNSGVFSALEEALDLTLNRLTIDPQIAGALGAALFAMDIQRIGE